MHESVHILQLQVSEMLKLDNYKAFYLLPLLALCVTAFCALS